MKVASFAKKVGESYVYSGDKDSELVYYVPEEFFNSTSKNPIAAIFGEYVSFIACCNWAIINSNGSIKEMGIMHKPTMILCKPYNITKEKDLKLGELDPGDYRLLHFKEGDEILSEERVPEMIENVELFFKLVAYNAKIPTSVPYSKIWELMVENGALNNFNYNVNYQLLGILTAGVCRSKKDPSVPFRLTSMADENDYDPMSIRLLAKYISPYESLVSENWDEGVRSAIMLSELPEEEIPYSPIEKIISQ